MMNKIALAMGLSLAAVAPGFAAEAAASFNDAQKSAIQQVVHDYLVAHPEVLIEASQALQKKQQDQMASQAKQAISSNAGDLFAGKLAVAGNPKGNVTLVEFFDYQCVHCKKMAPVVSELVKANPNLRVVYKEFPIFGKSSELASKAALAAAKQGKYQAMHDALIGQEKRLNENMIMEAAKKIGLNMDTFKKDMASQELSDELKSNRSLAEKLRLMGTPAFIIASTPNGQFNVKIEPTFIPGAASQETMQALIKKAQQG